MYGSKPKQSSSKFQMDEDAEEEKSGWDDPSWNNEEWDFEATTKSSKLDLAKQKQQQKSMRTGKAD